MILLTRKLSESSPSLRGEELLVLLDPLADYVIEDPFQVLLLPQNIRLGSCWVLLHPEFQQFGIPRDQLLLLRGYRQFQLKLPSTTVDGGCLPLDPRPSFVAPVKTPSSG